jgi:hypothetical protein
MSTPDLSRRFGPIAVLLLPVALVKGMALVVGSGPAGAIAAGTGGGIAAPLPAPPALVDLAPEQRSAVERIGDLRALEFGRSPMFVQVVATSDGSDPHPVIDVIQPLQIVVRGIMRTRNESLALIDGYLYREGQRLRGHDDWTIERIEASSGSIVVVNDSTGQMQIISVRDDGMAEATDGPGDE